MQSYMFDLVLAILGHGKLSAGSRRIHVPIVCPPPQLPLAFSLLGCLNIVSVMAMAGLSSVSQWQDGECCKGFPCDRPHSVSRPQPTGYPVKEGLSDCCNQLKQACGRSGSGGHQWRAVVGQLAGHQVHQVCAPAAPAHGHWCCAHSPPHSESPCELSWLSAAVAIILSLKSLGKCCKQ